MENKIKELMNSDIVSEPRWLNSRTFIVWVKYIDFEEFMDMIINLFGTTAFDDCGFHGCVLFDDEASIKLSDIVSVRALQKIYATEEFGWNNSWEKIN